MVNIYKFTYNNLKMFFKIFTHNYCDSCGFTKNKTFMTKLFMEAGFNQCQKCIDNQKFKN